MYRKFWLINSKGERYDFTDRNYKHFLNSPSGLGFVRGYKTDKIGNSEVLISQSFNLTDITGEVLFYEETNGGNYQGYQDFIQFCKYRPLELHYQTPNELDDYYCEVLFIQADKGEISYEDSWLHIPVVFHRLTEWLTSKDFVITLTNESTGDSKQYPLQRPYHYAGTNLGNTKINNQGTDDVGFIVKINGYCQSPQFNLSQNGISYGTCKINGNYDYVMVDSIETEEQIYLEYNGSVISNPKQYQDFTIANGEDYLTFIKLKVGESVFSFTCGNIDTFTGTVEIIYKNSYVTV